MTNPVSVSPRSDGREELASLEPLTLQSLAAEFQRWLDIGPNEQPHFANGIRPFSTGDLKAFVAAIEAMRAQPIEDVTPAMIEAGADVHLPHFADDLVRENVRAIYLAMRAAQQESGNKDQEKG